MKAEELSKRIEKIEEQQKAIVEILRELCGQMALPLYMHSAVPGVRAKIFWLCDALGIYHPFNNNEEWIDAREDRIKNHCLMFESADFSIINKKIKSLTRK